MQSEHDNKTILLVEDDLQDVELMMSALAQQGLGGKVTRVCDGEQALDYLYRRGEFKTRPPGNPLVVLLDNKMPKVSGLQVLQAMKADAYLQSIPVVALTSSRERKDLVEFYKNGVNAYVVKPLAFSDFQDTVKQLGLFWTSINEPPPLPAETVPPVREIVQEPRTILRL